jgi:hypothetical protein
MSCGVRSSEYIYFRSGPSAFVSNSPYPKFRIMKILILISITELLPGECLEICNRTMYNQIYSTNLQLPKWMDASISTPNGRMFFYSRDPVECWWYLLRPRRHKHHVVYGPTRTVDSPGHRVTPGATVGPLIC